MAHEQPLDSGERAPKVEPVPEGTVSEIMRWVGEDVERAKRALEVEQAHEKPRKSLVEQLNERLDG